MTEKPEVKTELSKKVLDLTLSEAKTLLQTQLMLLIKGFEADTGLCVEEVEFIRVGSDFTMQGNKGSVCGVTVRLVVP